MRQNLVRRLHGCVAAGLIIFASTCRAGAFTLNDDYYGATSTYGSMTGDTIEDPGTNNFEISSAIITRSGPGNGTLNITINTNFAGAPGTGPAGGTGYGSLFITPGTWQPTGTGPGYATDQYAPNEWQYAVTTVPSGNSGTSGLYAIGPVSQPNPYGSNNSVVQSYTTQNGTIVMSNVNGDPVTYPGTANPEFYFRQGQAVEYDPTDSGATVPLTSATWSVDAAFHTITYTIVDNGTLGDSFALAWAMTCANDVIQGQVTLDYVINNGDSTPTPIPATLLLMGSVVGAGGFIGRWRQKRRGSPPPEFAAIAA